LEILPFIIGFYEVSKAFLSSQVHRW
jgi:hypothetical protein